jgi:hypothetical protein
VLSIPGTLLAKLILPSTSIALGALIWSIAAAGMAGSRGYARSVSLCRLSSPFTEPCCIQRYRLSFVHWCRRGAFRASGHLALLTLVGNTAYSSSACAKLPAGTRRTRFPSAWRCSLGRAPWPARLEVSSREPGVTLLASTIRSFASQLWRLTHQG